MREKILGNPRIFFVFILYCTKRRSLQITPQLKVEIEDGPEALKSLVMNICRIYLGTNAPNCNCKKGVLSCRLRGECLSKSIIYRAEVTSKTGSENSEESAEYIGLSHQTLLKRDTHCTTIFLHSGLKKQKLSTSLSKHFWEIKTKMLHLK